MKFVEVVLMVLVSVVLAVISPWTVAEWQWWAFIAPVCFVSGAGIAVVFDD